MYASVADLRAEGVTLEMASDERAAAALVDASVLIDRVTGWFFEPRELSLRLDGRGTASIEPPVPPIRLDRLVVGRVQLRDEEYEIEGAPVPPWFVAPSIRLRYGGVFPRARGAVLAAGLWGFTEPDGTTIGRTPLAIRKAALLLALRELPQLSDGDAARAAWRIVSERTRDQEIQWARVDSLDGMTGYPDADRLLARFSRPTGLGAA